MKSNATILITGGTGLLGSALAQQLHQQGCSVYCTTRRADSNAPREISYIEWHGDSEPENLPPQIDVVVNLIGENIGARRWSATQKKLILDSRVAGTQFLIRALAKLKVPPPLFLSASAVGYYGNRSGDQLDESSPSGDTFLATVCRQWEQAAESARAWGATVTTMRFGVILSTRGGALKKMLPPFRCAVGGVIGSGNQYMSWVSLEDALAAISFLIEHPINMPVNICSPGACSNRQFTHALAHALDRPAIVALPSVLVKFMFGEMGEALLLQSTRAVPQLLTQRGFSFTDIDINQFFTKEFS